MNARRIRPLGFFLGAFLFSFAASAGEDIWTTRANMPTAREKLASCAIDGRIYVIGGAIGADEPGLTTNEEYDPSTDTWTTKTPMPTGRRFHTATVVDGKCYVIGGHENATTAGLQTVEEYDPATDQWSAGADMPTGRFAHAAAAAGGKVYVMGGTITRFGPIIASVEEYDPASDTWDTVADVPRPRGVLTASPVGDKVFLIGGSLGPGTDAYADLDMYDPATDTWTARADMPTARVGMTSSVVGGRIYAIGGAEVTAAVTTVEEYDPATDSWTERASMPVASVLFSSSTVDGKLFAFGGQTQLNPPHPGIANTQEYTPLQFGFLINFGITGSWANLLTLGQGWLFEVIPGFDPPIMVAYNFGYPPLIVKGGDPMFFGNQMWLVGAAEIDGDTVTIMADRPFGGTFDDPAPPMSDDEPYATFIFTFLDCFNGLVNYTIPSKALEGEYAIERITPDVVCEDGGVLISQ